MGRGASLRPAMIHCKPRAMFRREKRRPANEGNHLPARGLLPGPARPARANCSEWHCAHEHRLAPEAARSLKETGLVQAPELAGAALEREIAPAGERGEHERDDD